MSTSSFLFSKHHAVKKYLAFKIPFYKIKITLYPNYILKFSGKTIQKKWALKNSLKVVFLGVNPLIHYHIMFIILIIFII